MDKAGEDDESKITIEEAQRDEGVTITNEDRLCGCSVADKCPLDRRGFDHQCSIGELKQAVRREQQHRAKVQQDLIAAMQEVEVLHEAIRAKGLTTLKRQGTNGDYSYVLVPDDEQVAEKEPKTLGGVRVSYEHEIHIAVEAKQPIVLTPGESTGWVMAQNNRLLGAFNSLPELARALETLRPVERARTQDQAAETHNINDFKGW